MSFVAPSTSTGTPRPCLKRFQTSTLTPATPTASSSLQRSRSMHTPLDTTAREQSTSSRVHFPPTPTLSTTFPTHSKRTYDRRPLVVEPNACALPERGCPGRTYLLERAKSDPVRRKETTPVAMKNALERALSSPSFPDVRVREPGDDILDIRIDEEDDNGTATHNLPLLRPYSPTHSFSSTSSSSTVTPTTPTRVPPTALPALIPDHGISSSESDESDALTSPNASRFLPASSLSKSSFSPRQDERLLFLPHPPPLELRARDKEREKEREARRRRRREIEEERGKWKSSMQIKDEEAAGSCFGGF